jgi:hypothetical protein
VSEHGLQMLEILHGEVAFIFLFEAVLHDILEAHVIEFTDVYRKFPVFSMRYFVETVFLRKCVLVEFGCDLFVLVCCVIF